MQASTPRRAHNPEIPPLLHPEIEFHTPAPVEEGAVG